MLDLARRFIACVSRLVPSGARREFRDEWQAELTCEWDRREMRRPLGAALHLAARAAGALPDAWSLLRQQWSVDMLMQDVRYALRLMRQRVGLTLVVVLTLALGIGANTAMFSIIDAVLMRPLPFADPARLTAIWENDRLNRKPRYPVAPANLVDWQEQSRAFESIAAYLDQSATLSNGSESVRVPVTVVTFNYFDVLGVRPVVGQGFTADHAVPGHHRVLVLSYDAWQRFFGGDPGVAGRDVDVGLGAPYHILGVMPREFRFPSREAAFWRVLSARPETMSLRALHFLQVIGRRRAGVSPEQAQADMDAIAARQQRLYPQTNDQRGVTLVPLNEQIVGEIRRPLYVLAAAVFMVLLIACANIANLMLVRAIARRRELAVRAALGADRLRLVRQLLAEGLLLACAGGAAGLALAVWSTRVLASVAAAYVPRIAEMTIDVPVLLFLAAISMASGVFFAVAPAIGASKPDVRDALQDNARSGGGGHTARRFRAALVVAELAVTCTLVIGAVLVLKSFWRLMQVSPGFATEHILTADVELPESRYPDGPQITAFYETLLTRIAAIPGADAAGAANTLPMKGSGPTTWLTIENRVLSKGEPPEVNYRTASPDFFRAMAVPVLTGRALTDADTATSLKTVIVNRTLVERFFPGVDPLGTRIRIGPNPKAPWRTIVGVVGDMRQAGPEAPPAAELYLPLPQDPFADLSIVVRTSGDPLTLASSLRGLVSAIDPQLRLVEIKTMEAVIGEHVASRRLLMVLLGVFAALALGLAAIGIYGVIGYVVSQRTREIGVRMALGAQRGDILRGVLTDGGRLAAAGLVLGVALSLAATRLLRSILFDVAPTDPATFTAVAAGMMAVALVACYLPARRAARVDPLTAIRTE